MNYNFKRDSGHLELFLGSNGHSYINVSSK